jgi:hypothetical protein
VLLAPDGRRAYQVGGSEHAVYVVTRNVATGKRLQLLAFRAPDTISPVSAALSADGRYLVGGGWTFNHGSGAFAIDLRRGALLWTDIQPAHGDGDMINDVALEPGTGRVLLAEQVSEATGTWDPLDWQVRALDLRTGRPLWRHTVKPHDGLDQQPLAAVTGKGWFLVAGTERAGAERTDYDAVVRAYDTRTGALRGTTRYDSPAHGDDAWIDAAASDTGGALVVGSSYSDSFTSAAVGGAYTTTGRARWVKPAPATGVAFLYAGARAGSALVGVGGSAPTTAATDNGLESTLAPYAVAWDARTGRLLWQHQETAYDDRALDTVTVSGNRVYAAGWANTAWTVVSAATAYVFAPQAYWVMSLDQRDGSTVWTSRYTHDPTAFTSPSSLVASPAGVLIAGFLFRQDDPRYLPAGYVYLVRPESYVVRYDP